MTQGVAVVLCGLAMISACCSDRPASAPSSTNAAPPTQQREAVWATLEHQPLRVPTLAEGDPCPMTTTRTAPEGMSPAVGSGPLYAAGLARDEGAQLAAGRGTGGWRFGKVLWVSDPAHPGPWLVRGARIDAPGELRFGQGPSPDVELRLPAGGRATSPGVTWFLWPSAARIRATGCYAFQVDYLADARVVSTHIVFKA